MSEGGRDTSLCSATLLTRLLLPYSAASPVRSRTPPTWEPTRAEGVDGWEATAEAGLLLLAAPEAADAKSRDAPTATAAASMLVGLLACFLLGMPGHCEGTGPHFELFRPNSAAGSTFRA